MSSKQSLGASALLLSVTVALGCDPGASPDDAGTQTSDTSPRDASFVDAPGEDAPGLDAARTRRDANAPNPCDSEPGPCGFGNACEPDDEGGFVCTCTPPLSGERCDVVDWCASTPCENDGICASIKDGFTCDCADGFSGEVCETNDDDCAPNVCANGGTCVDGIDAFTCECATGFEGATCETNPNNCPIANPCMNGGSCVDGLGVYACDCAAGFGGDDCSATCSATGTTAVANGDWNSPATWGGVVPSSGTSVTIPEGRTVTIPAGATVRSFACARIDLVGTLVNRGQLTVDGTLDLRGPSRTTAATFTNEGTLIVQGTLSTGTADNASVFTNRASGTITSHGAFALHRFLNEGTMTVAAGNVQCTTLDVCTFRNTGTMTLAAGATFDATVAFTDNATNTGTLINHGSIETSRIFTNDGTFTNTGMFELHPGPAARFSNTPGATTTNSGGIRLHGQMVNGGDITNTGTIQVSADGASLINGGELMNEVGGSLVSYGVLDNVGTLVNRGDLTQNASDTGMSNTGTLTTYSTFTVGGRLRMLGGGTVRVAAGGSLHISVDVGNWGTLDIYGTLATFAPEGGLANMGTAHQRCGSTVVNASGAPGWTGTPAIVETPCL